MDTEGHGYLTYSEFLQSIKNMKLQIADIDIKNSFKAFDLKGNGQVEYDEFTKVIIGPMNKYRTTYVERAYDRLDINQIGLLDVSILLFLNDFNRSTS